MTRSATVALSLLAVGCLGAPPDSVAIDGGGDDGGGSDARPGDPDAGCPVLPALAPFSDDFTTGDLAWVDGAKPGRSGPGDIGMKVTEGELVFSPGPSADDHAWLQSSAFDFTSGRVTARITTLTTDMGAAPYLGIIGPAGEERMVRFDGARVTGPDGPGVAYSQAAHRWWQVLSEEGQFRYQVSADGVEWIDLEQSAPGFALDAVIFEVGLNVDTAAVGGRGDFKIDDLDLPPCSG